MTTTEPTIKRKCVATTAAGRSCKAWAIHDSNPPTCSAHAGRTGAPTGNTNRLTHGFYSRTYTQQESADLVAHAMASDLEDELAAARVALRRVFQQLHDDHDPADYAKLAGLTFLGVRTIAALLKTRLTLTAEGPGTFGALGQALDELAAELDIEL